MKKKLIVGLMLVSSLAMAEVRDYQSEISKVDNKLEAVLREESIKWNNVRDLVREKVDLEAEREYANLVDSMKSGEVEVNKDTSVAYSEKQLEKIATLDEKIIEIANSTPNQASRMKYYVEAKADIKYEALYNEIVEENPFDYSQVKMFHIF